MPLRIGFDLDGVLADMDGEVTRVAESLFNQAADAAPADDENGEPGDDAEAPAPAPERLHLTAPQQKRLWRHIRAIENFWERLDEIEGGSIGRLAEIAATRRWEIIFLTSRPRTEGDTTQVQTQRWLQSKGFPMPSVFVVRGSRGLIAASLALDAVIDDRLENCMDVVADSSARSLLVWRDGSRQMPATARRLGIAVSATVAESLETLIQLEAKAYPPAKPGPLDRVKRLLGMHETGVD